MSEVSCAQQRGSVTAPQCVPTVAAKAASKAASKSASATASKAALHSSVQATAQPMAQGTPPAVRPARKSRNAAQRRTRLMEALETRLEALTEALLGAQLAEKGIDMMKEIKELHTMLEALHVEPGSRGSALRAGDAPRITVVWGGGSVSEEEKAKPNPMGADGILAASSGTGDAG